MSLNLLIADDTPDVQEIVAFGARMIWPDCVIHGAPDGRAALQCFTTEHLDLVVLDVAMPPPDGFEVCRRIRMVSQVPILMLTVHDAVLDKVRALDLGADDYLTKPFDHLELLARLRALVRRSASHETVPSTQQDTLVVGDFALDYVTHEVRLGGVRTPLTRTEYRLLEELVSQAGTVVPHRQLLEHVWGPEYFGETHYLKVFIQRLRRKLGDDAQQPRYIYSEWGIGYRFALPQ